MKKNIFLILVLGIMFLVCKTVQAEEIVLQPGPGEGKDIWTTSVYSYAPGGGGPGGGLDNEWLQVGGWGDLYYTLIEFDFTGFPTVAQSARIELFVGQDKGYGTTGMYLDRITEFWDWRTQGTGSDYERLWWADRPSATQWIPGSLPEPTVGQWYSIDITDLYNAWQDGTYPNYGIQLRPVSTNNRWNEFYSSDYLDDPSLRPRLVLEVESMTFHWPVGPIVSLSSGHYGYCGDWPEDSEGCYWLSDSEEDLNTVWRDASPFQKHKVFYRGRFLGYHLGADYNLGSGADDAGEPVYPTSTGIVSKVLENKCGWGNIIFVKHDTSFGIYTSMYAHVDWLETGPPAEGAEVSSDVPIAYIGNGKWKNRRCKKGKKRGRYQYHLHFEIREGDNTKPGRAYTRRNVEIGRQGQIDPNAFIAEH